MLVFVVITCRLHMCDMFEEIHVMAIRVPMISMLLFIFGSFMEF